MSKSLNNELESLGQMVDNQPNPYSDFFQLSTFRPNHKPSHSDYHFMIINDIMEELDRQKEKWGDTNHMGSMWNSLIGKYFGRMCEGVCQWGFEPCLNEEDYIYNSAVKTAACCIAMMANMKFNQDNPNRVKEFNHNEPKGVRKAAEPKKPAILPPLLDIKMSEKLSLFERVQLAIHILSYNMVIGTEEEIGFSLDKVAEIFDIPKDDFGKSKDQTILEILTKIGKLLQEGYKELPKYADGSYIHYGHTMPDGKSIITVIASTPTTYGVGSSIDRIDWYSKLAPWDKGSK